MNLVIVESPAKAKTIEKYLGSGYKVMASYGHVRDLPTDKLGVNVKSNYEPEYIVPDKAKKTVSLLKREASKSEKTYLATDLDREGEAIAWHITKAVGLGDQKSKIKNQNFGRITFSEITKSAIEKAIKNPKNLNLDLVDAQQARRVLDRLVGYKLSPLLWKKVKSGLSAGRVQSVAVRLVVEREREIREFSAKEYWLVAVLLSKIDDEIKFKAFLAEENGKPVDKFEITSGKKAKNYEKLLEEAKYKIIDLKQEDSLKRPSAPFTTSTLQMEASRKLGFSAKQTMMHAQRLYEAGHITYMRTDSTNLSAEAIAKIRSVVEKDYGKEYLPDGAQVYKTKTKRAQEAHEAIRPTRFEKGEVSTDGREQRLYELITKRTIASQMKEAVIEVTEARILADVKEKLVFLAKGERVKFDGFIKVYTEGRDDASGEELGTLPKLSRNENLNFHEFEASQKFTEPPKRYTEATLVKKLESLGIGRPSTYAPTMSTIQERGYVRLEDRRFIPEEIGEIVNDLLVKHFKDTVDYKFTAKMEDDLDAIAEGGEEWQKVIDEFYKPFEKNLAVKEKELEKENIMPVRELKEKCPECKKPLLIRFGKYGKFVACSGYPECKYSRPLESKADKKAEVIEKNGETEKLSEAEGEKCEKCGGKMVLKEGRFGKFLACENYPKCKNTKTIVQGTGKKCPECGEGEIIERRTKRGKKFWGCSKYPGCKWASWEDPNSENSKVQETSDK
jgi:DNA topoisomerase-1